MYTYIYIYIYIYIYVYIYIYIYIYIAICFMHNLVCVWNLMYEYIHTHWITGIYIFTWGVCTLTCYFQTTKT